VDVCQLIMHLRCAVVAGRGAICGGARRAALDCRLVTDSGLAKLLDSRLDRSDPLRGPRGTLSR
jgi:hypothetical protein